MRGPWTPNPYGVKLARRLRQLREAMGLTQKQAGERLGRSRYRVQWIEAAYLPWSDEQSAMLDLYEVPAEERPVFFEIWDKAWQPRPARAQRVAMQTAVDDDRVNRNHCRIKEADKVRLG